MTSQRDGVSFRHVFYLQIGPALRIPRAPEPAHSTVAPVKMHYTPAFGAYRVFFQLQPEFHRNKLPVAHQTVKTLTPELILSVPIDSFRGTTGTLDCRKIRIWFHIPPLKHLQMSVDFYLQWHTVQVLCYGNIAITFLFREGSIWVKCMHSNMKTLQVKSISNINVIIS